MIEIGRLEEVANVDEWLCISLSTRNVSLWVCRSGLLVRTRYNRAPTKSGYAVGSRMRAMYNYKW